MTEVQFRLAAALAEIDIPPLSDAFPDLVQAIETVADVIAAEEKERFLKLAGL